MTDETSEDSGRKSQAEIQKLIEARINAIRTKDVDGAVAYAAPGILMFDVVDPLKYSGLEESRSRTVQWFSSFQGPIGYDMQELVITASDDIAFSHSFNHVSAVKLDGKKLEMWWRATICYRKIAGKWLITHEHNSVPFNPQTGQASLGLKP